MIARPSEQRAHRGRLIVFEGIDGAGKTLQVGLLAEKLRAGGRPVEVIDFPRYEENPFGELLARYLRGEVGDTDPRFVSLGFAMDRWATRTRLVCALEEGAIVLANRYVPSNVAFQSARLPRGEDRAAFRAWLESIEYGVLGLPVPDMVVLLDMPLRASKKLVGAKKARGHLHGRAVDVYERDDALLRRAAAVYRKLAQDSPNWVVIRCSVRGTPLPPEAISERVRQAVARAVGDA